MKNKLFYFLLLLILGTVMVSACWDTKDINDRAYITALGIDKATSEAPGLEGIPIKYKVTAEIIKPALLKENSWKLEPEKTGGILITTEGETVDKALESIQSHISRPITLSFLQVLVVGEEIADNIQDISSYFEKHPDVARRTRLVFVKEKEALAVLSTTPKLERSITRELLGMVEVTKGFSLSIFKPFTRFLSEVRTNNGQALGGAVILTEKEILVRSGSAVFDNWKLVGWLNGEETKKACLLFPGAKDNVFIGRLENGTYTYRVNKWKTKITPVLQNGDIKFKVQVKTDGIIKQEEGGQLNLSQPQNIKKLENLFAQVIDKEVNEAIAKSQKEFKVDYLNFGMRLMDKEPDYFHSLNWKETYPTVPILTEVQVKISRFGIAK